MSLPAWPFGHQTELLDHQLGMRDVASGTASSRVARRAVHRSRAWALALLLLAFLVRTQTLGVWGFWYDEGYSVALAAKGPRVAIMQAATYEVNTPLYLVLVNAWMALSGSGEFAARMPSVVASLINIVLVGTLVESWRGRLLTLLLMALSPLDVSLAQEARMYAQLSVLSMASVVALARYQRHPNSTLRLAIWAGLCIAAFLTHVLGAFVYLAQFAVFAATNVRRLRVADARVRLCAIAILPGLCVGAFLVALRPYIDQYGSILPGWINLSGVATTGFASLILPDGKPVEWALAAALFAGTVLGAGALFGRKSRWLFVYALLVVVMIVVFGAITGKFRSRYVTMAAPFLQLGLAMCVTRGFSWLPRMVVAAFAVSVSLFGIYQWRNAPVYRFDDFRGAIEYLRTRVAHDEAILLTEGYFYPMFEVYLGGQQGVDWHAIPPDPVVNTRNMLDFGKATAILNHALRGKTGAWLMLPPQNVADPARLLNSLLQRQSVSLSPVEINRTYSGITLLHYRFIGGTYLSTQETLPNLAASRVDSDSNPRVGLSGMGCALPNDITRAGKMLELQCFWRLAPNATLGDEPQVSIRLRDSGNRLIKQLDQQLAPQGLPSIVYPGEILSVYLIPLSEPLPAGDYTAEFVAYTRRGEVAPRVLLRLPNLVVP